MHDWFNAKSASLLVEASQARVSRKALIMDNEPDTEPRIRENGEMSGVYGGVDDFEDDAAALRDVEDRQRTGSLGEPIVTDASEIEVMETFATQTQTVRQIRDEDDEDEIVAEEGEETLREVTADAPPVFRPLVFSATEDLTASVKRRLRKRYWRSSQSGVCLQRCSRKLRTPLRE